MSKTAETKVVENRGETAAVAAGAPVMDGDEDEVTYVVRTPFKFKGRRYEVDAKVKFPRLAGSHYERVGLVRLPPAAE